MVTPLAVAALVAIWTWMQEPEYDAMATLLVQEEASDGGLLAQQVAAFTGLGGGRGSLETDLRLLESRQIAEQVVDSLALQVRVVEPRGESRADIFSLVSASRDAVAGLIHMERQSDGRYSVHLKPADESLPSKRLPQSVAYGDQLSVDGIQLQLAPRAADHDLEDIELHVLPFRAAVQRFLREMEVRRSGGSVIEVSLRDPDPVLAAAGANSVVNRFIDYRRETNQSSARGAITFLREQVQQYEIQLRNAEERLRNFRERETVISPEQAASSQAQRLSSLDAQRAEIVAERDVLAELVRDVAATAGAGEGSSAYRKLAAFPEFFRNPAVQNILSSLVQLENERAALLVRRTTENVDVRGLSDRIRDLEEQLYRTATNYLESLEGQIAALDRTVAQSTGDAARIPQVQAEFVRLTREVELLDEIYTLLQMRLKEQEVAESDARSDVRMLDAALVPLTPVSPRPKLNLLLGLAAGLLLGIGVAVAKAVLDPAMYSREVAVAAAGGVPILSSIPLTGNSPQRVYPRSGALLGKGRTTGSGAQLATANSTNEAYSDLRTRLAMFTAPQPQVVVVTSPREGDGKSTVAANLALAFAKHGTRTLLLEGDLRRPGLARQLGIDAADAGLGQVLNGTAATADAIRRHPLEDPAGAVLDVLFAGAVPRHPTELLDSAALPRLISALREQYDVIVVDTPPLDSVADALLLSRLADGALVVTRAGATDRTSLEEAVGELNAMGTHVHGLVLNGFAGRSSARYAYGWH